MYARFRARDLRWFSRMRAACDAALGLVGLAGPGLDVPFCAGGGSGFLCTEVDLAALVVMFGL